MVDNHAMHERPGRARTQEQQQPDQPGKNQAQFGHPAPGLIQPAQDLTSDSKGEQN